MPEKKQTKTTPKTTVNGDVVALVAVILMTKGHPQASAIENAKSIVEASHELVGK